MIATLEQTSRRLAAEETRWKSEAERADETELLLKENQMAVGGLHEALERQKAENDLAREKCIELDITLTGYENQLRKSNLKVIIDVFKNQKRISMCKLVTISVSFPYIISIILWNV